MKRSSDPSLPTPRHRPPVTPPRARPAPSRTARRRRALAYACFVLVLPALLYGFITTAWDRLSPSLVHPLLLRSRSILWVTAHPDDESFFFAPSILNLLTDRAAVDGHLLCLSIGDHEGVGSLRKQELRASCSALGIAAANCVALDDPSLPDTPSIWWPEADVSNAVREHVARWKIDLVITFDAYGVSGHANHRAISSAILSSAQTDGTFPPTFTVTSTNLVSKYSSLLSLPFVLLSHHFPSSSSPSGSSSLIINSVSQYRQARLSFAQHASQARWFRSLFILFSRYLWFVQLEGPVV